MATHSSILAWRIPWTEDAHDVPSQLDSGVHFWSKYLGRNVCFPYIKCPMMSVCPFLAMLTLWFFKLIPLFWAVLGPHCYARALSSCNKQIMTS